MSKILLCKLSNYLLRLTYLPVNDCVYINHTILLCGKWKQFQISHFFASHQLGTEEWLAGYFVGFSNMKWMKKGGVIWLDITLFETKFQHIHCNQTNLLKFPKCLEPWPTIIQKSKTQEEVGNQHLLQVNNTAHKLLFAISKASSRSTSWCQHLLQGATGNQILF